VSKKKKEYPICPCCNTARHRTEIKEAITEMERVGGADNFINSQFDWACDLCLNSKKAIKANPSLQNYCWNPHYAYFDSNLICQSCKTPFTFNIKEKQFWFESLKFWIDSSPVNCLDCRKEIRQLKKENKTLSIILSKKEKEISKRELETVIDIYSRWHKEERAKYYKFILTKRNKK